MKINKTMTTLSEAMNHNREEYKYDFEISRGGFRINSLEKEFNPEGLTIMKVLRFEGQSDPGDMSALYLIESDTGEKGMYIDAYGTYSDQDGKNSDEFMKRMKIKEIHSKD